MMLDNKIEIAILGGGITGLAASYKASEKNIRATVYESRNSVGGLLDNFVVSGYRFDHAVHLSFATEEVVRKVFDQTGFTGEDQPGFQGKLI